jgi:acyl dehydratase
MEFDVVEVSGNATKDLIFRKVITILQVLKKTVEPTWHESRKEDRSNYNPIHVSAIAAKLFGFPGKVAHGNQVATSMIGSTAAAAKAKTKTKDLWFDGERGSFMEVGFKRPMVVPLNLRVEMADVASKGRSNETYKVLEVTYNRI